MDNKRIYIINIKKYKLISTWKLSLIKRMDSYLEKSYVNLIYFFNLKDAEIYLDSILEENDKSDYKKRNDKPISEKFSNYKEFNRDIIKNNKRSINNINVFQYHSTSGEIINYGVIIWNKKTKQIEYKFLSLNKINEIVKLFPKYYFLKYLVKNHKIKLKNIKSIPELRQYIMNNRNIEFQFKYNTHHMFLSFTNDKNRNKDFKKSINEQYKQYIGYKF